MKAIIDKDKIVKLSFDSGTEVGDLPSGVGLERLRWDGDHLIDISSENSLAPSAFYVEKLGSGFELHIVPSSAADWQVVNLDYTQRNLLVDDDGVFRLMTPTEVYQENQEEVLTNLKVKSEYAIETQIDYTLDLAEDIIITDSMSRSPSALAELYNSVETSGGFTYSVAATADEWIQYYYPINNLIDSIEVHTDNGAKGYVAYSSNGAYWHYLAAEPDHFTTDDDYLNLVPDSSTAQTQYWALSGGRNFAYFPRSVAGKYLRLYLTTAQTAHIYEIVFSRKIVAEQIVAGELSTGKVTVISEDGRMYMEGNSIYIYDANDVLRVRLGRLE